MPSSAQFCEIRAALNRSREQKAWFPEGDVAPGRMSQDEAEMRLAQADADHDALSGKEEASDAARCAAGEKQFTRAPFERKALWYLATFGRYLRCVAVRKTAPGTRELVFMEPVQ